MLEMVGAVIIAHSSIGKELIATAEYIVGKIEGLVAVSIDCKTNAFEARKTIVTAIKEVDQGDGILLLTDLFGGSPSNIAFSFLNHEKIEVVSGANLPMILTFWNKREGRNLEELAKLVQLSGIRNIVIARDLMEGKGAPGKRIFKNDKRLSQK
jgi:PTS system mannose-specific IIA component